MWRIVNKDLMRCGVLVVQQDRRFREMTELYLLLGRGVLVAGKLDPSEHSYAALASVVPLPPKRMSYHEPLYQQIAHGFQDGVKALPLIVYLRCDQTASQTSHTRFLLFPIHQDNMIRAMGMKRRCTLEVRVDLGVFLPFRSASSFGPSSHIP
jgi:hypothetical protein